MANETERLQILLEAKANVTQAETEMGRLMNSVSGFLSGGVMLGIGQKLTDALAMIPLKFKEAIAAGFEFNSMMETNQVALAAALRTSSPESFTTFNQALGAARNMFGDLRKEARAAGVDIQVVSEIMAAMTGLMTRAGINLKEQPKLVASLANAVSVLGLKGQHLTEVRSILSGQNLHSSMLAKILGLDAESINAAKSSGTFLDLLKDKLKGFDEGASEAKTSWQRLIESIKAANREAAGAATRGMFKDAEMVAASADKTSNQRVFAGKAIDVAYQVWKLLAPSLEIIPSRTAYEMRKSGISELGGMMFPKPEARTTGEVAGPPVPEGWNYAFGRQGMPITDQSTADWEFWAAEEKRSKDEAARRRKEMLDKQKVEFAGLSSLLMGNLQAPSNQGFFLTSGMANASSEALNTQRSMLAVLQNLLVEQRLTRAVMENSDRI